MCASLGDGAGGWRVHGRVSLPVLREKGAVWVGGWLAMGAVSRWVLRRVNQRVPGRGGLTWVRHRTAASL